MSKPVLKDWFINDCDQIVGQVYGDSRFEDGEFIITSRVVRLDAETGEVFTKNSEYLLGPKLGADN